MVLKEDGRGAVERYVEFWNVEMKKKNKGIDDVPRISISFR